MSRPRLTLAEQSSTTTALADAKARLEKAQGELDAKTQELLALQKQAQAVNDAGVQIQKTILGIEGEIKALSALVN